ASAGFLRQVDAPLHAHADALGAARAATPTSVRRGGIEATKSIGNALVAQSGVQAALLAEAGITASLNILDDTRGLPELFRSNDLSPLTQPISGEGIMAAHVKFFPCVNTAQTAVAAAIELHRQLQNQTADIQRI